jgi:hypothetical protein
MESNLWNIFSAVLVILLYTWTKYYMKLINDKNILDQNYITIGNNIITIGNIIGNNIITDENDKITLWK